ncbi:LacI family DNA-binding transcriptional regulator [Oenococcus oeni]|uniref:LacI family DNA-binding transcriptional regulator n=1 Tax=Oenococcus oeni TaxID=1247 RepID=UPI00067AE598|nr:LacI family DNA-binding transcriptional regulator [Oenococcus oeni]
MNKKITIKNVAKAADVSVATVSHVLNNYPDISEKTKRKVNQVVERLGYSPNIATRSLVYKKQKTIALILNEIDISKKFLYLPRYHWEFLIFVMKLLLSMFFMLRL